MFLFRPFVLLIIGALMSCTNAAQMANKYDRISDFWTSQGQGGVYAGDLYIPVIALSKRALDGDKEAVEWLDKNPDRESWVCLNEGDMLEEQRVSHARVARELEKQRGEIEKLEKLQRPPTPPASPLDRLPRSCDAAAIAPPEPKIKFPSRDEQMDTLSGEMAQMLFELDLGDYLINLRDHNDNSLLWPGLYKRQDPLLFNQVVSHFPEDELFRRPEIWFIHLPTPEMTESLKRKVLLGRLNELRISELQDPIVLCAVV